MADLDKNNQVEVKSEKKPVPAKKKEKGKLGDKIKKFLREYKSELKKIVWYSPKQTAKSTVLVVVTIVIAAACIGALDFVFSNLLTLLGRII